MVKMNLRMDRATFDSVRGSGVRRGTTPHTTNALVYAIKMLRIATGLGLKDTKDAVDELIASGYAIIDAGHFNYANPEIAEAVKELASIGIYINADARLSNHVRNLREMACMLIMEGNEHLARDVMELTEKWGKMCGSDTDDT
jgi:hypothetical protein